MKAEETTMPRTPPAKPEPKDPHGAKRIRAMRDAKERFEAYLDDAEAAEAHALIAAGEGADKADLVRKALHEKYLRWKRKKT